MTSLIFTLLISLSFSEPCHRDPEQPFLYDIFDYVAPLNVEWSAAKGDIVRDSPCRKEAPTSKQIQDYFQSDSSNLVEEDFFGIKIKDTKENIQAIKDLLTPKKQWYDSNEEWVTKTAPKPEDFNLKGCSNALCLSKRTLGNKLGPKLLYMKKKYGLNGSHLVHHKSQPYKDGEIDSILTGLESFPEELFPMTEDGNKRIARHMTGDGKELTIANAQIFFYDLWAEQSPLDREATLIHELGHELAAELEVDESDEWINLSGWEQGLDDWSHSHSNIVSEYGQTNPAEDFAESFLAYRYNPELLKTRAPKKYDFIKNNVFLGREFFDESNCQGPSPLLKSFKEQLDLVSVENIPENNKSNIINCGTYSSKLFDDPQVISKLRKCYAQKEIGALTLAANSNLTSYGAEQLSRTLIADSKILVNRFSENTINHLSQRLKSMAIPHFKEVTRFFPITEQGGFLANEESCRYLGLFGYNHVSKLDEINENHYTFPTIKYLEYIQKSCQDKSGQVYTIEDFNAAIDQVFTD